jgi:hypothetical protein
MDEAAVKRGNANLQQMLNTGPEKRKAILEAMLHEILAPTKATGALAAWINEACLEKCENYHVGQSKPANLDHDLLGILTD